MMASKCGSVFEVRSEDVQTTAQEKLIASVAVTQLHAVVFLLSLCVRGNRLPCRI